jgi:pyruvate formate lyase activating enzyme
MPLHGAMFYEQLEKDNVRCWLCPHHCLIHEGRTGLCGVRQNRAGKLYSLNYAEVVSIALDPIEKKPLYHFFPGSNILSLGTFGCNFFCPFCQNYSLARGNGREHPIPRTLQVSSQRLLEEAVRTREDGSVGVAFTYNEPAIWYEYVLETAQILKTAGQKVVLVSNGYIESQPLRKLLPYIDAMNIDVKAFNETFYQNHCRGSLAAVMNNVEAAAREVHVEITTLMIPGENDDLHEIASLAEWLASLDKNIVLHLSRYHPAYRFEKEATPVKTLLKARNEALKYLRFVYLGNTGRENDTLCMNCGGVLIERRGYYTRASGLEAGHCRYCKTRVDYIKC